MGKQDSRQLNSEDDGQDGSEDPHPLLTHADETALEGKTRKRLTAERCSAVEKALRSIGFAPGTSYWSVALLVARVAGWQTLRRSLDDIASDPEVCTSAEKPEDRKRVIRRALNELQSWGLLTWETETGKSRRRTRAESVAVVTLNRQAVLSECEPNTVSNTPSLEPVAIENPENHCVRDTDNGADNASDNGADNCSDNPKDRPRTTGRTARNVSSYTLIDPIPLSPSSPLPSERPETTTAKKESITWEDAESAIRSAGVEHWRPVLAQAREFALSPGELVDAAYVVRHTAALEPGALSFWVRSGGWPRAHVKSADAIREQRSQSAAKIRREVFHSAPPDCSAAKVAAVVAARLIKQGLAEFASREEMGAYQAAESTRRRIAAERIAVERST